MAAGLNIKRNSRIFHIANECYIIYLGMRSDEDRPFLRVGNMENIDDKILDVISNTVVSARFTGNPLFELKLDKEREINYIGDTAVIERLKTYLDSFHLPSSGAVDYHNIKDREQRDVVYFYNNGNIKLNYQDEPIFDLYKRSEADYHFVYQCDEIKKQFARNPLRYTKHDFRESGILLGGNTTLLFSGGRFFSAALNRDYFSSMAAAGVDPDQIGVHYSTIKGGHEEDEASYSLIEMLKRSSYRNTPFTVYAKYPVYAKKICALFPGAVVVDSGDQWSMLFPGMKVRDRGTGLEVNCSGFPMDMTVGDGSVSDGHMNLNPHTKTLSIREGGEVHDIAIPEGILCNIKKSPSRLEEMTEVYISRFVPLIKGFSTEDDYKVSLAIQKLLKMLASVVDGKAKSGLIMRSTVFNFSDLLKRLTLKNDSILTFFLENSLGILDLALDRSKDMEGKIVKNIHSLQSDIRSILIKSVKADPLLPVAADIYTADKPMLFFRSVKSTAKKADFLLAGEIAGEILSEQDLSPKYYRDEKDRLLKLIGMLESATDLEVDKILEKQKPAEPQRTRKQEIRDDRGTRTESVLGEQEKTGATRKGLRTVSPGRRRSLLWLLLIPLIALAAWGGYKGVTYLMGREPVIASVDGDTDGTGDSSSTGDGSSVDGSDSSDGEASDGTSSDEAGTSDGSSSAEDSTSADDESDSGDTSATEETEAADESSATGETSSSAETTGTDAASADGDSSMDTATASAETADDEKSEKNNESELKVKDPSTETDNREIQSEEIVMDTDSRPSSAEEVRAYLNVGDIHISLADIHLVSNKIAVDNDYRDLDYEVYDGADPDWIYPGNEIVLPDGTIHLVVRGDAIWYMAARYIRTTLDRDLPLFENNKEKAAAGDSDAVSLLEKLMSESPCAAFREKIHEVLKN